MEKRQSRRESTARRDERGQRSCRTGPPVAAMPVLVCVGEGRPIGERRTGARVHAFIQATGVVHTIRYNTVHLRYMIKHQSCANSYT